LLLGAGTSSNEHLKSSGPSTLALGVAGRASHSRTPTLSVPSVPLGVWNTGSSIVSESSSNSARLAEICQILFGAAVDCRYMQRGKELYLGQDVPKPERS
jgi:hypothetical protein